MSKQFTPEVLMEKAEEACSDARLLIEKGSSNGAVNRAYYAMFNAARAVLLVSGAPVSLNDIRTHKGLIGAFGKYLVKDGPVSRDMGHLLNKTKDVRMAADYDWVFVDSTDARTTVEEAETFVITMRTQFMPNAEAGKGSALR
jgi:uncharacterized protein (UPF0332 family)